MYFVKGGHLRQSLKESTTEWLDEIESHNLPWDGVFIMCVWGSGGREKG